MTAIKRIENVLAGAGVAHRTTAKAKIIIDPHMGWYSTWDPGDQKMEILRYGDDQGDDSPEAVYWRSQYALEDKIIDTPALTLSGVVTKLMLWVKISRYHGPSELDEREPLRAVDYHAKPAMSALHDLRRMLDGES